MLLTDIQVKTAAAFTFLYGEDTIPQADIPRAGQAIMDGLQDFVQQTFIEILDVAVWAYDPLGDHMKLQAGFPVKSGTQAVKPFAVRDVPEWKCLSAVYNGPMDAIQEAWAEMSAEVEKRGLKAAGEIREIYKLWVDVGSAENVTELQVRLK
jgi:effector-binding domain-containing protein